MVSGQMVGRVSGQLALGRWVSLKEEEEELVTTGVGC